MNQKLEALELHGYKTFATKTPFAFPDKITAIVGPNGSGKSNIADSIRWVLGEQAYSILRGKKTEDMIYSGSAQRSKMSMASATIRFNNEDGWLPIDYDVVSITRRAYRSGENEYLINEKKVRLRDIQELLANSGLAERTYTIIGQGLVDSALSLKPQDRRLFFEEAAGIRLYRARREEAIRKLDKTVENMDRVKDILYEIRPRIARLEKQVERAKEYNRINADLQLLLKDWYGYRWNLLQQDYRDSLDAKIKKETELNSIRMEVTAGDEEMAARRKLLQEKRDVLSILNNQLSELQSEKEKINRELAIIGERFKGYEEQRDSLRSSMAYAEEELKSRLEQKADFDLQHSEHEKNLEKIKNELNALETSLNQKKADLQKIHIQIENLQQKKLEIDKTIVGNQAKSTDLETRVEILIKRRTELDELIKTQDSKFQEILTEVEKSQAFFNEKQNQLNQENNTLHLLNEQKEKLSEEIAKINNTLQKYHNDLAAKETQLNVLITAKKNMEGFKTGTKKLLNAFQQKKVQGTFELLLSCLRVQSGYEKAVAAILGDATEGLILDRSMELKNILSLVREAGDSHSILIPQALLKENKSGAEKSIPGCRPILDFVQSAPEYQSVLQILFSDTYILEDQNKLEQTLTKLDKNQKIVLKDGGIFYGNGIISVGGATSEFIFKREKEIEDLYSEIKDLKSKAADIEALETKQKHVFQDLEEKITEIRGKITSTEKEVRTIQSALKDVQAKQADVSQDIRLNKQLVGKLLIDIQEAIETKNTLKQNLKESQIQTESLHQEIEKLKRQAETISVDDLNQDYFQKKTEYAVIQESFLSSKNRLQDSLRLIASLETQCNDFKERLNSIENQHTDLMGKYNQHSQRAEELNEQINSLLEKTAPIEEEISTINAAIEKHQNSAESIRKNQSIIERHFIQLEMRVDKIKNQMDSLKERISDDFGLVSYDYEPEISGPKPLPIDGMVANLPKITQIPDDLEDQIKTLKSAIHRIGAVNPEAEKEFREESDRYEFLTSQIADLEKAENDLRKIVVELEEIIKVKFKETFKAVNEEFSEIFKQLFGGGSAKLVIEDEENITETGIEIEATLPGKRKQELALLSGGERSLTAIALIFSLLKISPTPFCVLDEVDAMLDESNVLRLGQLMKELSDKTQFIVITHNRNTVQLANVIYGVTMGRDSTSQVISLKLEEVTDDLVE
ncbi:MAG: chromosome segregation protein SMC [Anaerolineaceae bacterium]|jgi:chromosome segregation protein|nr:MAG: chromosome segregation protein SMC [Anaerolineaceae bacterium]